ncbi:MAG: hypothetical protein GX751_02285 [Desulfuromonadaceae bacterium]|nr:hypothetical protein [Desulfuromonadaceae bacterium]
MAGGKIFILGVLLVQFMVFVPGCSNEDPPAKVEPVSVAEITLPGPASQPGKEEKEDFYDNGEECIGHEYIVVPGMTVTMDFQVRMKKNIIADLGEKALREEEITPEIVTTTLQTWEQAGVISQIESIFFDREESTILLWGVRVPLKKTEMVSTKGQGNAPTEPILVNAGTSAEVALSFPPERDFGIILQIGGHGNPRELADLSYDKLIERTGGKKHLIYEDKDYAIEQIPVPLTRFYTTLALKTSFPLGSPAKTAERNYCLEILGTPLCLSLSINPQTDNRFHVYGPWDIWDCR